MQPCHLFRIALRSCRPTPLVTAWPSSWSDERMLLSVCSLELHLCACAVVPAYCCTACCGPVCADAGSCIDHTHTCSQHRMKSFNVENPSGTTVPVSARHAAGAACSE